MFFPASLIINCFLIQVCIYLSAKSALSRSDEVSSVIKSRSDSLSTWSSTEANIGSSTTSSSDLNLNKSQLVRHINAMVIRKLALDDHLRYSFLFILIDLDAVFYSEVLNQFLIQMFLIILNHLPFGLLKLHGPRGDDISQNEENNPLIRRDFVMFNIYIKLL